MFVKATLVRLVVIRRDDENGIGTGLFGVLRQLDRFHRIVGAGTGNDRNAASRNLDANLDDTLVLVMRKGRRFTGRADRNQSFGTFFDLPVYKCAKGFLVERSFGIEWRDKRGN